MTQTKVGQGLVSAIGTEPEDPKPKETEDEVVNADSIEIQFEQLNQAHIYSEISIAYAEIINGFKESSLPEEDLHEALSAYHLDPFDAI